MTAGSWTGSLALGGAALGGLGARRQPGGRLGVAVGVELCDLVETRHPQCLFQVFQRAFRLSVLLVKQVIQNVLVALDKTLGVLLSVLELLVTVTLDALEKGRECQLLLVAQLGLLLLDDGLHLCSQEGEPG